MFKILKIIKKKHVNAFWKNFSFFFLVIKYGFNWAYLKGIIIISGKKFYYYCKINRF